jgi:circadian clock protein KaiC
LEVKCSTGIQQLDEILHGGFPKGSLILVSGSPGTGKTILATRFLYNGAINQGEIGLYVSFGESPHDYYKNMGSLGMDLKSLEKKNQFKLLDYLSMSKQSMQEIIPNIIKEASDMRAKRIAIDSITAILQMLSETEARSFLHAIFGKLVKEMGVTTIMIGEIPYLQGIRAGPGIDEFVSDGIILLKASREGPVERRQLEIVKMRGVPIERASFEYLIDEKSGGIDIITLPTRSTAEHAPNERVATGISGLDAMLRGGVYKNSITLIEGAGGIGKTTLCLQFLVNNARKGERGLFLSFEEPIGQIMRTMSNYGMKYEKLRDRLVIESYVPESLSPLHYYQIIRNILETQRPSILIIDSLTAIQHVLPRDDFIQFIRYVQLLSKEKGLTVFLTSALGTIEAATQSGVSTLSDNIILLTYRKTRSRVFNELSILKTRGSPHDRAIRTFEINSRGIKLAPRT